MFNSSLQETLARYSDPSRNPYAHRLRSQPPGPSASQYLLRPLRPKLDLSLGGLPTNQWKPKLKIDIETQIEQPPGRTLQVFDSRGYYIQSLSLRTRSQPRAQKVLPGYLNPVTSAHGTNVDLGIVPSIVHNSSASRMKHGRIASSVAPQPPSIRETTGTIAPASSDRSLVPGSCANPIVIADTLHTQTIPDILRLPSMGHTPEKEGRTEKGERRDAGGAETKEHESTSTTNEAKGTETGRRVSASNWKEDVETKRCESATGFEPERPETESYESTSTEADRTERDTCKSATMEAEITTNESVADEATTEKDSHTSTTPKLLRMERKINNKDLFMGWYMSETSSELRHPYECIAPKIGDVYVHCFRKEGNQRFQLWVRQISRGMTIWVKAHIFHIHPKLVDRRLTLSMTGEPYWATRTSLMASGSRERASKVAEMIFYN